MKLVFNKELFKRGLDSSIFSDNLPASIEDLRKVYRKNDFTTKYQSYTPPTEDSNELLVYEKACEHFKSAFIKAMCDENGRNQRQNLLNFTKDAPITVLEQADEKYVVGEVMKIFNDENVFDDAIESFGLMWHWEITEALARELDNMGIKPSDYSDDLDLSEELELKIMDEVADKAVDETISLLLQIQNVPGIIGICVKHPQREDFTNTKNNYDRNNFLRKWYGAYKDEDGKWVVPEVVGFNDVHNYELPDTSDPETFTEIFDIRKKYLQSLSEEDRVIFRMAEDGYTQKEIARVLGLKSQGTVSKRIRKMRKATEPYNTF